MRQSNLQTLAYYASEIKQSIEVFLGSPGDEDFLSRLKQLILLAYYDSPLTMDDENLTKIQSFLKSEYSKIVKDTAASVAISKLIQGFLNQSGALDYASRKDLLLTLIYYPNSPAPEDKYLQFIQSFLVSFYSSQVIDIYGKLIGFEKAPIAQHSQNAPQPSAPNLYELPPEPQNIPEDGAPSCFTRLLENYDGEPKQLIGQHRNLSLALWSKVSLNDSDLLKTAAYYYSENRINEFDKILSNLNKDLTKNSQKNTLLLILKTDGDLFRIENLQIAITATLAKSDKLSEDEIKNFRLNIKKMGEIFEGIEKSYLEFGQKVDISDLSNSEKEAAQKHMERIKNKFDSFKEFHNEMVLNQEQITVKLPEIKSLGNLLNQYQGKPERCISAARNLKWAMATRLGLTDLDLLKTAAYYHSLDDSNSFNTIFTALKNELKEPSLQNALGFILESDGTLYKIQNLQAEITTLSDKFATLSAAEYGKVFYEISKLSEIIRRLENSIGQFVSKNAIRDPNQTDKKAFEDQLARIYRQFDDVQETHQTIVTKTNLSLRDVLESEGWNKYEYPSQKLRERTSSTANLWKMVPRAAAAPAIIGAAGGGIIGAVGNKDHIVGAVVGGVIGGAIGSTLVPVAAGIVSVGAAIATPVTAVKDLINQKPPEDYIRALEAKEKELTEGHLKELRESPLNRFHY